MFFEVSENPAHLAGGLIASGEGSARVSVAANARGGPFYALGRHRGRITGLAR